MEKLKEKWGWVKSVLTLNIMDYVPTFSTAFWITLAGSVLSLFGTAFFDTLLHHHEALRNLGLLAAAVIGFPLVIWRTHIARQQTLISEANHISEMYSQAVEQLGALNSSREPALEIRLGGLYTLENLANKNPEYHAQIMDFIAAYVRMNSPKRTIAVHKNEELKTSGSLSPLRYDIQVAVSILCRRNSNFDAPDTIINLSEANLSGLNLSRLTLKNITFYNSQLITSAFYNCIFDNVRFDSSKMLRSRLTLCTYKDVRFFCSHMDGCWFRGSKEYPLPHERIIALADSINCIQPEKFRQRIFDYKQPKNNKK